MTDQAPGCGWRSNVRRALVVTLAMTAISAAEASAQRVRLLAIGNSFSRNVLDQLPAIAVAAGRELVVLHCAMPGGRLEQHWQRHEAARRDPSDPKARYNNGLTLDQALARDSWDVITIQQYSLQCHDAASYQPYAGRLVEVLRRADPQARILLHQSWAYRCDDPRFTAAPSAFEQESNRAEAAGLAEPPPGMHGSVDMHRMIAEATRQVADSLGLGVIPSGDAFALAEADATWGFVTDPAWDPQAAAPPSLPEQSRSLHVGWYWKTKDGQPVRASDGALRPSYDGHHANACGSYLAACVWFAVLFNASPIGITYRPGGMPAEQAAFLQQTAQRAAAAWPPRRP
ncbi:MAG TPA: hypothetical protein DCS97_05945 [Planctomycetes bacterium]|nr:hypothetical protein [Planctomycetota bacterium]